MTFRLTNAAASAAAGDNTSVGISSWLGNGSLLKFYTGAVASWGAGESAPAGTLLSTDGSVLSDTMGVATNGVLTAPSIANDTASNSGTAGCWMWFKSDGTTPLGDGNASTSAADINFNNNVFVAGGTIAISSLTLTVTPH